MARDSRPDPTGIAWDPDPEADDYLVYMDPNNDENFLELVDGGVWPVHSVVTSPEYLFTAGDPTEADFAVVSHATVDGVEYWSDPFSPGAWQDIRMSDANPLTGPSNGRVLAAA